MPRSAAEQRLASVDAVLVPSPIAVKRSSSMAALSAAVRWNPSSVSKIRRGDLGAVFMAFFLD